jgi:hypothetical protein
MEKPICHRTLTIAAAGLLLFAGFSAPGLAAEHESGKGNEQATDLETLRNDWAEALESLKDYSAAQRDQALEKAGAQLDAMDEQIERMQVGLARQWNDLSIEARERREASLRSLRRQRNELAEWYGGMKHSSRNAWDDVKQGFVEAYQSLGDSFDQAVEEFQSDGSSGSGN